MKMKPGFYKFSQVFFVLAGIISILILGRVAFVMGMAQVINQKSEQGNYDPAELYYLIQAYSGDFMEPYKAFYNAGTAYAQNGDYASAEAFLTASLAKVDYDYNECLIRNNLSITYEKLGDYYKESELLDTSESYYDKAVQTVQEAPLACFPPPPPSGSGEGEGEGEPSISDDKAEPDTSGTGEELEKTEDSSQEKGDQVRDEQGDPEDGKGQVEEELDQSKSESDNKQDQADQEENNETSPEQVEKPW